VTLDTKEFLRTVRFTSAQLQGKGVIIIDAVAIGSPAESKGIKPGQRLVAVSDPVQGSGVMWSIEENSSIRFLVDAIRLSRSPTTVIIVEDPDPTKPAPTVTRPSTQQHPQTESDRVISNVNRRIAAREE